MNELITPYVRNAINLNQLSNGISQKAGKVYVDAARDVLREFADVSGSTEDKMSWLNAQAEQIRDTLASANDKAYNGVIKDLTRVLKQQSSFQARTLRNNIRSQGLDTAVKTVQVSPQYVEALVNGESTARIKAGKDFFNRSLPRILPDEEKPLKEQFRKLSNLTNDALDRGIRSGLLQGKTTDEIVKGFLNGDRIPKNSPLKKTEAALKTVVRSSMIGVSAEAQIATIEANADITDKYEFLATLDSRTTPICMANDRKVFSVKDGSAPRPPLHWGCRSGTSPYLDDFFKENGIDIPTGTRASVDGQVDGDLDYEGWLKQQPIAVQNDALGKGKADLFRKGLNLSQIVREDGTTKTIEQLERETGLTADAELFKELSQLSLSELRQESESLGAERSFIKQFGSLKSKDTWIKALLFLKSGG